jgi:hypothetical protein
MEGLEILHLSDTMNEEDGIEENDYAEQCEDLILT